MPIHYAAKKAILFDADGTIIDTFRDIHNSINRTLEEFGLPLCSEEESRRTIGPGTSKLASRILRSEHMDKAEKVTARYREIYFDHCVDETKLYPFTMELLDTLKGRSLAVVSNKPQRFTEKILETLGIIDRFEMILCSDTAGGSKPDPKMIHMVIDELDIPLSTVLLIGDSDKDILAARRAGIECVAVSNGYTSFKTIQKAGPDLICADLKEVEELFLDFKS